MIIDNTEIGRVEVRTLPLPEGLGSDVIGTYTYSGRVLVAVREPEKGKDWYRVFTVEDDGTGICELFSGEIPQKPGANGIRWMCYADNRRVLLGDYVLECCPDLDHCESSELIDVVFPPEISRIPRLFMRWSEPIIAPDNVHVCFSSLTAGNAFNFLGRLVRRENAYVMEDVSVISTIDSLIPDPQDRLLSAADPARRRGQAVRSRRSGHHPCGAGASETACRCSTVRRSPSLPIRWVMRKQRSFRPTRSMHVHVSALSPGRMLACSALFRSAASCDHGKYLNAVSVLLQGAFSPLDNIGPALINVERP